MRIFGLPPKLRLAPLWPALAALLTAAALLWLLLPRLLERSAAAQLNHTVRLLTDTLGHHLGEPRAELQARIHRLGADSGLRITLMARDGTVLADSAVPPSGVPRMENHAGRPEVRRALSRGEGTAVRRSETTGEVYVYAAGMVTDARGTSFILRVATPLRELDALRRHIASALGVATLAAAFAIVITAFWINRRVFAPLYRLIAGAGDLASGRASRVEIPEERELAALALSLNHLAATAEAQFAAVRNERDHLMAILSSMSEGVLVVDGDGRALLVNPAFRRLFDLAGEVAGRLALEIIRHPQLARVVEDTLRLGESQGGQIELRSPERRTLLLASAALAGGERGAVLVARDTTELTRVADMRRDFVANVSHELKTPLAAIRGYAETLQDGALDEPDTARRFTDRILSQCRRLQALLDDLLTLSRLEGVALPTEREPVDLHAVVQRSVEVL
ncbi:MAG TPA: histidine kinase dimerization/phospho-acceptor domain-containing protein, partial [Thermoanaerobaculia bacterium]|nr:histidine kinase dimerization/phospho-acceptor domain-containing protein [Thermoanaerobaculia bacterium]